MSGAKLLVSFSLRQNRISKEDSRAPSAESVTGAGPKALAIYGLANFMFQCAEHGHSPIPL